MNINDLIGKKVEAIRYPLKGNVNEEIACTGTLMDVNTNIQNCYVLEDKTNILRACTLRDLKLVDEIEN